MKLAIISHTEHYISENGKIVGWGPTVMEVNHLLNIFDEIWHIGVLNKDLPSPANSLPYVSDKIHFVPIAPFGGQGILKKLDTLLKAPKIIRIVHKTLKKVDWFQFRAPTGIGVYLIPYLTIFSSKKGWYKYAGNWAQATPPIGYYLQRFWLKNLQRRKVTINGKWENQPKHCISFENPCLSSQDLLHGEKVLADKKYKSPFTLCFAGRVEAEKGVEIILNSLNNLPNKERIKRVHIAGEGKDKIKFENIAKNINLEIIFHGSVPRKELFNLFVESDFFVFPSTASEGFPKVIAESINFGCINVVSTVSSIPQYIEENETGFLVDYKKIKEFEQKLFSIISDPPDFKKISNKSHHLVKRFSYEYYINKIKKEILNIK